MIYDGSVRDTTNFSSAAYLAINSCNIQQSGGRAYTVVRHAGRVDYHILYVVRGECTCLYDGKIAALGKGQLVLYPPNVKQWYSFAEGNATTTCWVHFSGYGVKELLGKLGLGGGVWQAPYASETESAFEKMIYNHLTGTKKGDVAAEGELLKLLSSLSVECGEQRAAYSATVKKMLSYIHANWQKSMTVADVAAHVCLSESRTAHLFAQAIGKGIHQYVNDLRISSARELLLSTDLSVGEIGEMVGFRDALYFSRAFKERTGTSPRAFRTQFSQNTP